MLNGASSSGKSSITACLQAVLPEPWLAVGIDTLIRAMPVAMTSSKAGIEVAPDGAVSIGAEFRALEDAWTEGVAMMARAGARIIVDDVFLSGQASQRRWLRVLDGLGVLWVGVRCESTVAAGRELARRDRVPGQSRLQVGVVHEGVRYDVEVDTTRTEAIDCARHIADHLRQPTPPITEFS